MTSKKRMRLIEPRPSLEEPALTIDDLKQWYFARDTFLGLKYKQQNMVLGLELARECRHEDAKWLVSLFPDEAPRSEEEAKCKFLDHSQDARALAFAGLVGCIIDKKNILMSAQLGCAQAQAWMSLFCYEQQHFKYAEISAAQNEPAGLAVAAECYWDGDGCQQNLEKALAYWEKAAILGDVASAYHFGGKKYSQISWERYFWWGEAARGGFYNAPLELVASAADCFKLYLESNGRTFANVIFAIGEAFCGNVKYELTGLQLFPERPKKPEIPPDYRDRRISFVFERRIHREDFAHNIADILNLHKHWIQNCKTSIFCWIWIGRNGIFGCIYIPRDIRNIISKLLWAKRYAWALAPPQ